LHIWTLAQYFMVAGQVHVPAMHGIPVGQTLPQSRSWPRR
jgi:hypothetical protein